MVNKDMGRDVIGEEYHMKADRIKDELRKSGVTSMGDRVAD